MRALQRNLRLLDLVRALRMALFAIPVIVLFWQEAAGIGVLGVFALQAIFSGVMLLLEVPSGWLCDRIGRKPTLIAAALAAAVGFALYASASGFAELAAAEVVLAVGAACWSGTDAAMLYETLAELGRGDAALGREARSLFWRQATESAASVAGGYLAVWVGLRGVVWLTALPFAATALLACWLVEPRRATTATPCAPGLADLARTIRAPALLWPTAVGALLGSATLCGVWLHQLLWQRAAMPRAWFGWAWAALNLAVALSALLSVRLERRLGTRGALAALGLVAALAFAVMGWWASPWVALAGCLLNTVRGAGHPIVVTAINRAVTDDRRATMLSLYSFASRGVFTVLGPVVGWLGQRHGLGPACLAAGLALGGGATALALLGWSGDRIKAVDD